MSAQSKPAVRPGKTLEQPASEKPRGTSDQDALAAHLLPQRLGAREDAVEIVRQPVCRFCAAHVCVGAVLRAILPERRRQLVESDGKSPPCNRSSIA